MPNATVRHLRQISEREIALGRRAITEARQSDAAHEKVPPLQVTNKRTKGLLKCERRQTTSADLAPVKTGGRIDRRDENWADDKSRAQRCIPADPRQSGKRGQPKNVFDQMLVEDIAYHFYQQIKLRTCADELPANARRTALFNILDC